MTLLTFASSTIVAATFRTNLRGVEDSELTGPGSNKSVFFPNTTWIHESDLKRFANVAVVQPSFLKLGKLGSQVSRMNCA